MSQRLSKPGPRPDMPLHPMERDTRRLAQIRQDGLYVMMGLASLILGAHALAILLLVWL
ncbi:hypothetical protein [Azorhizobium doebereinerae]|uniref:hypothetical protein n=1 Tax=Azorhizobium doebereinerae TaxID=281091 RepID=UPI000428AF58|nr:hypothetical protein [Azorhizobium doebereinerae]